MFSVLPQSVLAADIKSTRLDGKDRFEVAVNVSKAGWSNGSDTVVIANFLAFADALSASPLAYKHNAPILLSHPNELTATTKREIQRLKPKKVIIIGGPISISENIVKTLKDMKVTNIERFGGETRFDVAYNIASRLGETDTAIVTNGMKFMDAMSIAPYAAKNGYPILLTYYDHTLPKQMDKALDELQIKNTIISGGELSVSKEISNRLPKPKRIGGEDRYEVSANILEELNPNGKKAFIATGRTFADALTGSVLAAKEGASMLLSHPTKVHGSVKKVIADKKISNFVLLGGTISIPNKVFLGLSGQENTPPLKGRKIILDEGHGGKDPGAVKNGLYEKVLNMEFTNKLADELKKFGAEIIYTRPKNKDTYLSLEERTNIANQKNADLFISVHHDSNTSSKVSGLSTHYSSYRPAIETKDVYVQSGGKKYPFIKEITSKKVFVVKDGSSTKELSYEGSNIAYDPTPSKAAKESKVLAERFAKSLVYPGIGVTGIYSKSGVRDHNLYVTRWTTMPSVLIELGFMSNPQEVKLLSNKTVQEKRAKTLANEIKKYYQK
ncbi:cell wall-binding repeat-containing protein [Robertmurraya massiliosenegalensis]